MKEIIFYIILIAFPGTRIFSQTTFSDETKEIY